MIFIYTLKNKYEKKIVLFFKLFISVYAVWFVSQKDFNLIIPEKDILLLFLILIVFSLINWWLEIKKWQFLARNVQNIDFKTALKQSLIGFSLASITPNRIGEYGAKAVFYPKQDRKKILALNFVGNTTQLLSTLFFGSLSIVFLFFLKKADFFRVAALTNIQYFYLLFVLFFSLIFYLFVFKKFNYPDILDKTVFYKSFVFSVARYLIFSTQFFLLYIFWSSQTNLLLVLMAIYLSYFLSSLLPVLIFTDWAIKGSISLWVFTKLGLMSSIVLKIVGFMWIFNFLIPFFTGIVLLWLPKIYSK